MHCITCISKLPSLNMRAIFCTMFIAFLFAPTSVRAQGDLWTWYMTEAAKALQEKDYLRAESQLLMAISEAERIGPVNDSLAESLNTLGALYAQQSQYRRAEPILHRAIAIREQILGVDDPFLATSLANLGHVYISLGDDGAAEPLYRRALVIDERALGPENTNVAVDLKVLGRIYYRQLRYEEAESAFRRAVAIFDKGLSQDNGRLAATLVDLAILYLDQYDYRKAEPLYQRALTILGESPADQSPDVSPVLYGLALICLEQRRHKEAEELFRRALSAREAALGRDHSDLIPVLEHYAVLYRRTLRQADAVRLEARAAGIRSKHGVLWRIVPSDRSGGVAGRTRYRLRRLREALLNAVTPEKRETVTISSLEEAVRLAVRGRARDRLSRSLAPLNSLLNRAEELAESVMQSDTLVARKELTGFLKELHREHNTIIMSEDWKTAVLPDREAAVRLLLLELANSVRELQ